MEGNPEEWSRREAQPCEQNKPSVSTSTLSFFPSCPWSRIKLQARASQPGEKTPHTCVRICRRTHVRMYLHVRNSVTLLLPLPASLLTSGARLCEEQKGKRVRTENSLTHFASAGTASEATPKMRTRTYGEGGRSLPMREYRTVAYLTLTPDRNL